MDCRLTLNANETFLEMLESAYQGNQKVSLLIDIGGVSRMEGQIVSINQDGNSAVIELNNGEKLVLGQIVAVNGVFRAEYGEC